MGERKKQLGAIDAELIRRVDAARGDVSRIRWVGRAIEQRLEAGDAAGFPFDDSVTAAAKAEYVEKSAGGTRPVEVVVEAGSMVPTPPRPSEIQLAQIARLPRSLARRALADGSWTKYMP